MYTIWIPIHVTMQWLLLLKPAAQAQVGKIKLFINCFRNPTSTCETKNWRKHNSGKQPTVDCTLELIQLSGVKHRVGKVILHSNLGRQERPSKLGRSTPWYFKLQWMSCGRSSDMSNSNRSRSTWEYVLYEYLLLYAELVSMMQQSFSRFIV